MTGEIEPRFGRSLHKGAMTAALIEGIDNMLTTPGRLDGELTPQEEQQFWQMREELTQDLKNVISEAFGQNVN